MNKAKRNLGLAIAALPLLLSSACNNSKAGAGASGGAPAAEGKIVKLGFVTNNPSQFWKIAEAGLRKYEKEAKIQVDMKMPPNGTPEDQNQILQNLASQGYDAIAVSVVAPKDQLRVLNEVAEKTSLITFDSDADKSKRLLYIGTNNFEAGKALGERIAKLLPDGGKIAVFVGTLSADNAAQRLAGVEAAIKDKKIEIVDKREDNTDRAKARSNVEDIVNAHKDLNLVVGLWNYNGPAIAAALQGLGKQGKVKAAVFDEDEATLDAIKNGTIEATVVQKPFQFGYLSAKWMHELATKPAEAKKNIPANGVIDTGVTVIDKSNVEAFKAELTEMRKSVQ
ncbi:MAG: ABC-type sugar transport system, periplasmic component [Polyangiaceae bacterium]|jgi:ribose transport system substrate-binding protein|nr:ABC-type sugar transport system, periplasmic component [Polyangiaceae bacterium]